MADVLKWYEKAGQSADVVCSTRVRLARNLNQRPFPAYASKQEKEEIEKQVRDALLSGNSILAREFRFLPLEALSDDEAVSLAERHLVSPAYLSDRQGKGVLMSDDESVSIMINEEDHLRIQVLREGLALKEAAETADRIDTLLNETLSFAFDPEFGYLTQCPTNLGTGLRASLMLHLPALTENGAMARMASNLSKLGLALRGTYGEGSQIVGAFYQLSNQITLGISENEAIQNLLAIAGQLMDEEYKARAELCATVSTRDKICRAAGLLKTAQLLSNSECMELLSLLRLGLSSGILQGISTDDVNALTMGVQPATLMAKEKKRMDQTQRDTARAALVRQACSSVELQV